jgi:hypothetical protein
MQHSIEDRDEKATRPIPATNGFRRDPKQGPSAKDNLSSKINLNNKILL